MQLFTIGLWKMNPDGTRTTDANGNGIPSYTQADVLDYSRAWTGFTRQAPRGNLETFRGDGSSNYVDPLKLRSDWRDYFPKMGLDGKYIGDGLPLCAGLPSGGFLSAGARYRYIGTSHKLQHLTDPNGVKVDGVQYRRLRLANTSALYAELCRPDAQGACAVRSTVVLPADITCSGVECSIDAPRGVEVVGARNITFYYEYVRGACVDLTFLNNGQAIASRNNWHGFCVDPRLPVAQTPCCSLQSSQMRVQTVPFVFAGERATLARGAQRCANLSMEVCPGQFSHFSSTLDVQPDQGIMDHFWLASPCSVQAQVYPDGVVTAVNNFSNALVEERKRDWMARDSLQVFRVLWEGGAYPTAASGCSSIPTCEVHEQTCVCAVEVVAAPVFASAGAFVTANASLLLSRLHIGSLAPAKLSARDGRGTYVQCSTGACGPQSGFKVWVDNADDAVGNTTIVEVEAATGVQYFANVESMVSINRGGAGAAPTFRFRNPPNFMRIWDPTVRDAAAETEAVLDTYFTHPNVAPHVAMTLISKLTISNPSPAYVSRVAQAFRTGSYEGRGSGKYGDLAATVYAVLLDSEAVSVALEGNPVHGAMREPMVKLMHAMRALSFEPYAGGPTYMRQNVVEWTGMFPYRAASIFNFFQPAYFPPGVLGSNGLVSPESQLLTGPNIVGLLNGLLSLNVFGLNWCDGGFGRPRPGASNPCWQIRNGLREPGLSNSGNLTRAGINQTSVQAMLDDLSLYLTGGRLHALSKAVILDAHRQLLADGMSADKAATVVVQMVLSSAEFHQTGGHMPRVAAATGSGSGAGAGAGSNATSGTGSAAGSGSGGGPKPYRAIVYLFLNGGTDSFNLLVPRAECVDGEDLYAHYREVRTNVALEEAELTEVAVPAGTQVCDRFGVLKQLQHTTELYNAGNATFLANVGALVEPISNSAAYSQAATRRPPSLFAHNVQQKATQTSFAQFATTATGVMGRIRDVMTQAGTAVGSYSLAGNVVALTGDGVSSPVYDVVSPSAGVALFDRSNAAPGLANQLHSLLRNESMSFIGDVWRKSASNALSRSESLGAILDAATLSMPFAAMEVEEPTSMAQQFYRTAQLIASRAELGNDRDLFMLELGGFDTHFDAKEVLQTKAGEIDAALQSFSLEMQAQGLWDNVTVLVASEFGRTLTSNGAGTDHAWGGNALLYGGGLNGGRVLGKYPRYLNASSTLNVGRGRMIPTTSWEAVWKPLAEWIGVDAADMGTVLPNAGNFNPSDLLSLADVYGV